MEKRENMEIYYPKRDMQVPAVDELMLIIGEHLSIIKKIGIGDAELIEGDGVEIEYLNVLLHLIQTGYYPEYIAYIMDCKLAKIIMRNDIDDDTVERLFMIKHLARIIQDVDDEAFLIFADFACTGQTRDNLRFVKMLGSIRAEKQ